jgi:IS5 family transposase
VVQAPNDKHEIEPTLDKLGALPAALGEAETLLADAGYFSGANVEACAKAGVEPVIAMGRQPHHPPLAERISRRPLAAAQGSQPRDEGIVRQTRVTWSVLRTR